MSADPPSEREVRAFVGRNADYYLRAWRPALTGGGRPGGFHLAGFILPWVWLGYRRLYRPLFILFGLAAAELVLEEAVFIGLLRLREPPAGLSTLVGLATGMAIGAFANRWYYAHAVRTVDRVRAWELPEDEHFQELARRGRTSLVLGLGLPLILLTLLAATAFAVRVAPRVLFPPSPEELAGELKPIILEELRQEPGFERVEIRAVTLAHKGGNAYAGSVEATLHGLPERWDLDVTDHWWDGVTWVIKPPPDP